MTVHKVALLPGDGIGVDVVAEGVKVLEAIAEAHGGFSFDFTEYPWSCDYYLQHGSMMPPDGLDQLDQHEAIYMGACGFPSKVPDHISLWGMILPIRKKFDLYINLRPVKLLKGVRGPLRDKDPEDIDFVCVRENTEGEYSGVGGRVHVGTPHEVAIQSNIFTRHGVERVMRYSFELAQKRPRKKLLSVTKSNACQYSMVFWDEVFDELKADYPDVNGTQGHVDAVSALFVKAPEVLDVIVASNLFADILTDLGGALQGSLGLSPSANIDPSRRHPSLFEAVHGSAPDIAGKGIANPIATIWAGAMMLEFLGYPDAESLLMRAIESVTEEGKMVTPDLGGKATTVQVGDAIVAQVRALARSGAPTATAGRG